MSSQFERATPALVSGGNPLCNVQLRISMIAIAIIIIDNVPEVYESAKGASAVQLLMYTVSCAVYLHSWGIRRCLRHAMRNLFFLRVNTDLSF